MSPTNVPHAELISLSRQLADRDLVDLAEGNTSVRDKDSFWVKASGKRMGSAGEDDFVRIDLERAPAAIAIAVRHELRRFAQLHGHLPKTVLLGNHGLVALGTSPTGALNISIMAENGRRYFMLQSVRGAPLLDSGGGNSNRRPTGRTLSTSSIAQSEQ